MDNKCRDDSPILYTSDGATISIIATLQASVQDPGQQYEGIGQSYRVVANVSGTLELVPLAKEPTLLKDIRRA